MTGSTLSGNKVISHVKYCSSLQGEDLKKHTDFASIYGIFNATAIYSKYTKRKILKTNFPKNMMILKAEPRRFKQLTKKPTIRILSQTSIFYLIRYDSVILIVGFQL